MLVRERGWSGQKYQHWVADALVQSLLTQGTAQKAKGDARIAGLSDR
jgi:hypothetical protein